MTVIADDVIAEQAANSLALRRPSWLLGVFLDTLLGVSTYLAAYWLRFESDRLALFLPAALSSAPLVVGAQVLALLAVGAYAPRPRTSWLSRVIAGVLLGTAASAGLVRLIVGFEGISRMAFLADALLLSIAAIGWRGAWVLRARAHDRALARASSAELVDRADEMTFTAVFAGLYRYRGLLKVLVLKDLKLKYRGSVFGFLWSLANPLMMIVVYTVAFTVILGIKNEMFVFYLMLGQLSWAFFAGSVQMSTGSIIDNAGLLRTVLFPRAILPIGTVLFNFAQYILTLSVFLCRAGLVRGSATRSSSKARASATRVDAVGLGERMVNRRRTASAGRPALRASSAFDSPSAWRRESIDRTKSSMARTVAAASL